MPIKGLLFTTYIYILLIRSQAYYVPQDYNYMMGDEAGLYNIAMVNYYQAYQGNYQNQGMNRSTPPGFGGNASKGHRDGYHRNHRYNDHNKHNDRDRK